MNMGRPLGAWPRWMLRPMSRVQWVWPIAISLMMLWGARVPGLRSPWFWYGLLLWAVVATWFWVRSGLRWSVARAYAQPREVLAVDDRFRRRVRVLFGLTLAVCLLRVPEYLGFAATWPALRDAAAAWERTPAGATTPKRLHTPLYTFDLSECPHELAFTVEERGQRYPLYGGGFVYAPDGPHAQGRGTRHVFGPWYLRVGED